METDIVDRGSREEHSGKKEEQFNSKNYTRTLGVVLSEGYRHPDRSEYDNETAGRNQRWRRCEVD